MQKVIPTSFILLIVILSLAITGCQSDPNNMKQADLFLYNAIVYPVIGTAIDHGAVVIRDQKIIAVGDSDSLMQVWQGHVNRSIDCKGQFLMPGFIEGHGHFSSLGKNLVQLDLLDTKSWDEIVDSVANRVATLQPGEWIIGRGWHQEKWSGAPETSVEGYPLHHKLSEVSPDNPVMLQHASGHAIMANDLAMKTAGISKESPDPSGGRIVRNSDGMPVGVFEENAENLIKSVYLEQQSRLPKDVIKTEWISAITKAQEHCHTYGITSFQDAGSTLEEVDWYTELAEEGKLTIRLYAMIYDSLHKIENRLRDLPMIGKGSDHFSCRAIKSYMDGALGSRGAWLLAPYDDRPDYTGQNTTTVEEIRKIAELCQQHKLQCATHAIGDRGNREVLDVFEKSMSVDPAPKQLRWRIEHAQHIDPSDIPRFASLGVIASMQAIHCTSDSPFVIKRLGEKRAAEGAYPWRSLLDAGAIVTNGTDVPVERVDPIANYYASVTRKAPGDDIAFYPEQSMTREEGLYALTMANAYSAFEENLKGSLESGKYADLVLLSKNLVTCAEDEILGVEVVKTIAGGKVVYERK